ncbi:hypothetical protein SBA_ch1_36500 [Sphingomonas bisphenolicum]|uniref:Uncharacterized protein n=2 Tax=Sphingomonas bisphenolicum TaxID=296544 RepID=A0ABM7G9C4_9SPHN|nr:hypothetical protein SBA_ch1_36500 [Sphingomonas bisphenolicum]
MLRKFSRTVTTPITISPEFFRGLRRVMAEMQALSVSAIRTYSGVTEEEFNRAAGTDQVGFSEDRGAKIREARMLIADFEGGSYSLAFANGSTIETNDLDQVELLLATEHSIPTEFAFSHGKHGVLRLRINIGKFLLKVITYDIEGTDVHVNHMRTMLDNLISGSKTDYPFFFSKWHSRIFGVVLFCVFVASFMLCVYFTKSGTSSRKIYANLFPIYLCIMPLAIFFITDKYAKLFPSLKFDYGRSSKDASEARTVLLWVLGVVLIPVVLGIAIPLLLPTPSPAAKAETK